MGITISGSTRLVVEDAALPGVKRVAGCVLSDMAKVFSVQGEVAPSVEAAGDDYIIVATVGYSDLINSVDISDIGHKREVYKYTLIDGRLAIIGSDKRGTIYGLFHLSELLGVSSLVDWFGLNPAKKEQVIISEEYLVTSKEPSVRYRGFFINDEWPAFGNWCEKNFGGFNAKAYEQIFLLLLRMKGNYMWPAMWSAIFPDDGPGLLNEQLADELGVVMGMSHHEPCLRQGEEYRYLRGKDSIYGDAWNFRTNEAGITKFWEDGLKRSGKFENVITVGMRGEADTAIMGQNATLKDNIDLLRDVLKTQNRLIRENVNENLDEVPRMLALYKEVEPYFYGDETTEGLMNSPELEGVTLMLCDDNYGNLRTVPTEAMQGHKGGYGMYYHFDYHGFPISFEWVNSSYLPKVWEQMSAAYEFGIRDLWIVNVGDLFSQEYPLSYFLDLAYDYEKWGISNINSASEYTSKFINQLFGERVEGAIADKMYELLMGYTKIAHNRRPEAMNSDIYSPVWNFETRDLLCEIAGLEKIAEDIRDGVDDDLKLPVFELMYYPAMANLNVQKLQLTAGLNHFYSEIGCTRANVLAAEIEKYLQRDVELVDELHRIDNGRWYGMGLSEHIGFNHWCEEECTYPVIHTIKAGNKPRIIVSIPGTDQHTEGGPWTGKILTLPDFLTPGVNEAAIELLSSGAACDYRITTDAPFISIAEPKGTILPEEGKIIPVSLDRAKYTKGCKASITVDTACGKTVISVPVCENSIEELKAQYDKGTYIWQGPAEVCDGVYTPFQYISIEAAGYSAIKKTNAAGIIAEFKELPLYGKTVSAMKAFPVNVTYDEDNSPSITYTFEVIRDGEYIIEALINQSNAPFTDGHLYYGIAINDEGITRVNALPEGFKVGDNQMDWLKGVLGNIRVSATEHSLKKGINTVTFMALSPGFVLEKILIYEKNHKPANSYLGPKETYRV